MEDIDLIKINSKYTLRAIQDLLSNSDLRQGLEFDCNWQASVPDFNTIINLDRNI